MRLRSHFFPGALALAMIVPMASAATDGRDEAGRVLDDGARSPLEKNDSAKARAIVDSLRARLQLPRQATTSADPRGAVVRLPALARDAFDLHEPTSGMRVQVALAGATESPAETADGMVVYPRGHESGADVVHRLRADGTEDYVSFEKAPAREGLRYQLSLGDRVAGLRLVENTLELLDGAGAPRLRMAPPYVVDRAGAMHSARVALEGCRADTSPKPPWKREVTSPGAHHCTVDVDWSGLGISYPAIVDPVWISTANMAGARDQHSAGVLSGGLVLIAGGRNSGVDLVSAELYDPATGTWAATGSMATGRFAHAATVIQNDSGKLLVAGGYTTTAELYDLSRGTWSSAGTISGPIGYFTATSLANGKVVVAGGRIAANGTPTAVAQIYDPATNKWTPAASLLETRSNHAAVLLRNGKVIVVGGSHGTGNGATALRTSEIYDPVANVWASSPLVTEHFNAVACLLSDGRVLTASGFGNVPYAEVYNPATNSWAGTGRLIASDRTLGTLTTLANGKALFAGGYVGGGVNAGAELYDPALGTWSATTRMASARALHTASLLANGDVLIAGGRGLASAERYLEPRKNGDACVVPQECASGFCVDGVCCDTGCTGLCTACSSAKKGSGNNGACGPIAANSDPDDECAAGDAMTCKQNGSCNGAGACALHAAGAPCGETTCQAAVQRAPACDGTGTCKPPSETQCAPYQCDAAGKACLESCKSNAECTAGNECNDNVCGPPRQENGTENDDGCGCKTAGHGNGGAGLVLGLGLLAMTRLRRRSARHADPRTRGKGRSLDALAQVEGDRSQ